MLAGHLGRHPIESVTPVLLPADLLAAQEATSSVFVSSAVRDYVLAITGATRSHPAIALGCSPRGSLALMRTAQARAALTGRSHVTPDDVKALAAPVMAHRLLLRPQVGVAPSVDDIIGEILTSVPVPLFEAPRANA